jgi:hypothetical protein
VPGVGVTADPVRPMLKAGFEAFEPIATLPGKLPAEPGAKVTVKEALCPGVKVTGTDIPEMLKPVPVTVAREIVAFSPPIFFTVSVCA